MRWSGPGPGRSSEELCNHRVTKQNKTKTNTHTHTHCREGAWREAYTGATGVNRKQVKGQFQGGSDQEYWMQFKSHV